MTVFETNAPPYANAPAQWTCVQCDGNIVNAENVDGACRFHTTRCASCSLYRECGRLRSIYPALGARNASAVGNRLIVHHHYSTTLIETNGFTGEGCQRAWHRPAHHNDYPYEAKTSWSSAIMNYTDKGKVRHCSPLAYPFTHYL